MEKEGGAEYWGFMSPFGNRFVRYICLLALHEPLFQSLLLLVTKLKVELTIKTKVPNSISICKKRSDLYFFPSVNPFYVDFLLEDGEINQLLCGIFLLCDIGCWCRCPLQDGKINQLLSNFVLFWNRTINFHTHNKELALEYHQKWFSRLKEKNLFSHFSIKSRKLNQQKPLYYLWIYRLPEQLPENAIYWFKNFLFTSSFECLWIPESCCCQWEAMILRRNTISDRLCSC